MNLPLAANQTSSTLQFSYHPCCSGGPALGQVARRYRQAGRQAGRQSKARQGKAWLGKAAQHRHRHQGIICREKGVQLANAHGHMACVRGSCTWGRQQVLAAAAVALTVCALPVDALISYTFSFVLFLFSKPARHVMKRESNHSYSLPQLQSTARGY